MLESRNTFSKKGAERRGESCRLRYRTYEQKKRTKKVTVTTREVEIPSSEWIQEMRSSVLL